MAPKKKPQKQKSSSSSSQSKSQSSSSSGPRLQISAENESRLRRLLLNSAQSTPSTAKTSADDNLSKAQKAKRLRSVYEKLSCEGFSNDQIELALSSLKDGATFEAALDWLCLNLPGNELPLKFSSGSLLHTNKGSVSVISTARGDWTPSVDQSDKVEEEIPEISVRIKGRRDGDTLDLCQQSQVDWIRRYVEQQEEDYFWMTRTHYNELRDDIWEIRSMLMSLISRQLPGEADEIFQQTRQNRRGWSAEDDVMNEDDDGDDEDDENDDEDDEEDPED